MGKHLGRAEATAAGEWSNFVIFLLERGVKRTRCSAQMLYAVFSNLRRLILVPREIITLTLVGSGLFLWVVFFSFFGTFKKSEKSPSPKSVQTWTRNWVPSDFRSWALPRSDPTHKPAFDKRIYIFLQFSRRIYLYLLTTENDTCNNGFI